MASKGFFDRLLEKIGLVDDEPEEDLRDDRRRGDGTQAYSSGIRNRRNADYNSYPYDRYQGNYSQGRSYYSSARPEESARRRTDYQPQPRYGQDRYRDDSRGSYGYDRRDPYYPSGRQSGYRNEADRGYRMEAERSYTRARSQVDEIQDEFDRMDEQRRSSQSRRQQEQKKPAERAGNVVAMQKTSSQANIYQLRKLEECRDVINDLLDNKTILLNLENMNDNQTQRAIDTLCGAAFALGATLKKAGDRTYLIAPTNVKVSSYSIDDGGY